MTGSPTTTWTIAAAASTTTTPLTGTAPTSTVDLPPDWDLGALAGSRAGPVPAAATCPPGSTPDLPGDPQEAGPAAGGHAPAAFDLQSGVVVYGVGTETWALDVCRNTWQVVGGTGPTFGDSAYEVMVYDADSDLVVAFDGAAVWTYDFDADTWTRLGAVLPSTEGQGLYHHPSGLVVTVDGSTRLAWAYDVAAGTRVELGLLPARGLLGYHPRGDGFYLYEVGQWSRPAATWRYAVGSGWAELEVGTPGFEFPVGDLFSGREITVDETTGRLFIFSGGMLAAFDPSVPAWEILDRVARETEGSDGPGFGFPASLVWDPLNERLLVLGGWFAEGDDWSASSAVWAYDAATGEWIGLWSAAE